jgi:hypothetical protein
VRNFKTSQIQVGLQNLLIALKYKIDTVHRTALVGKVENQIKIIQSVTVELIRTLKTLKFNRINIKYTYGK